MKNRKGIIVLMGSGELTATMVEVHKEVLARLGASPSVVFLDTPAGFQLNADQLSQRAVEYFQKHVGRLMKVASYKSKDILPLEVEEAFRTLRKSDYVLVGPGSPTYAVRQWLASPVPDILTKRIESGGCLVAASAAALTIGRFTMPVYEIYKVGDELHWDDGMNILGSFGLNYVVIPHWNNAEGGTHDTRFCFMGETRFRKLTSLLHDKTGILGLDEHTACIIDFELNQVSVRGIGSITIQRGSSKLTYEKGETFSIDVLRGIGKGKPAAKKKEPAPAYPVPETAGFDTSFWNTVHSLEEKFHNSLKHDPKDAINAILELDRNIWKALQDMENEEFISQAREVFRELIVLLGTRMLSLPVSRQECLTPLVNELIKLRDTFRKNKQWKESDALRDCLNRVGIIVADTDKGPSWHLK